MSRRKRENVKRRELILGAGAAVLGALAHAQTPRRYRLGILGDPARIWDGDVPRILEELGRLGYARGVRLEVHERNTLTREEVEPFARQLVAIPVDVILTEGTNTTRAAQRATKVIPIVTTVGDPVAAGFARTLQHPRGNVTGMSENRLGLMRKQIELLRLLWPGIKEIAILGEQPHKGLVDAASEAGIRVRRLEGREGVLDQKAAFEKDCEQLKAWHIDTAVKLGWSAWEQEAAAIAIRHRIAFILGNIESVESGALMAAEPVDSGKSVRVAGIIDKIFRGRKPGDIPFDDAARFITAVNARTAAALGIRLTPEIRLRVDRVVE
jgi:putative ABC transport system substrate-binding protein